MPGKMRNELNRGLCGWYFAGPGLVPQVVVDPRAVMARRSVKESRRRHLIHILIDHVLIVP